jgi:putative ATP-binding cassette transporter
MNRFKLYAKQFWLLVKPYFFSEEKWGARCLFALVMVLMLSFNVFNVVQSFILRDLMTAVTEKQTSNFYHNALMLLASFALFTPAMTFFLYSQNLLQLHWRKWLTKHFLKRYFNNQAFYKIKFNNKIDNPDQRIAEDLNTFIRQNIDLSGLLLTTALQYSLLVEFCFQLIRP